MCEFLAWLDNAPIGTITEIDVVIALESFRRANSELLDISFDTISASGPNAALPHYRVNEASNRLLQSGEVMLVDSGGQYLGAGRRGRRFTKGPGILVGASRGSARRPLGRPPEALETGATGRLRSSRDDLRI